MLHVRIENERAARTGIELTMAGKRKECRISQQTEYSLTDSTVNINTISTAPNSLPYLSVFAIKWLVGLPYPNCEDV